MRVTFNLVWLVYWVKLVAFHMWAGFIQSTEDLHRKQFAKRDSVQLLELGHWSSPALGSLVLGFSFRLGLELHYQFPWVSSMPTVDFGLLSLHVSQFLTINLFININFKNISLYLIVSYWFCFSGEYWLDVASIPGVVGWVWGIIIIHHT